MAKATVTPPDEIWVSTIHHVATHINQTHDKGGHATWIVPFGYRARRHQQSGIQYCPMCLKTDKQPYFRKSWRLAYYTECERHHILMHDRCPHCSAAINFFHLDTSDLSRPINGGLDRCGACDGLLHAAMPQRFDWPDKQHALTVRTVLLSQDLDWRFIDERVFRPASSFMRVVRMLVAAMSSKADRGELYDHVARQIWPEGYDTISLRGMNFEFRIVDERHRLFGMALWLLMDWPHRLEAACLELCLSDGQLTMFSTDMPEWFHIERLSFVAPWYRTSRRFKLN